MKETIFLCNPRPMSISTLTGLHGGAVSSNVALQVLGSTPGRGSFCVEFACSPCMRGLSPAGSRRSEGRSRNLKNCRQLSFVTNFGMPDETFGHRHGGEGYLLF
ncbi:hypothetical protein CHARACLAT_013088 [Characodon lateralis]|uniref:Uncharacterized protein n=1 Tax=Characodon lateralis TaxID=208331 RepID=A0ABU7EDH6_9TELE|nr:hypothetical protein [Characodon lateralis]